MKFIGSNATNASDLVDHALEKLDLLDHFAKARSKPERLKFLLQLDSPISEMRDVHGWRFKPPKFNGKITKKLLDQLNADPDFLKHDKFGKILFGRLKKADFYNLEKLLVKWVPLAKAVITKRYKKYLVEGVGAELWTKEVNLF